MCINLQTSIIAYLIGTISSLLLIKNNNKEKNIIGYFVLFYTCVQLFEALIYNNNKTIYSRLLLTNLGLQGLVLILLLNNYITINKNYIYIFTIISLYITYRALQSNFKKATVNSTSSMIWNFFLDKNINLILNIMYILGFIVIYHYKNQFNYINTFFILLLLTNIISFNIDKINPFLCKNYKPSIWCLSSAIISPIVLLL